MLTELWHSSKRFFFFAFRYYTASQLKDNSLRSEVDYVDTYKAMEKLIESGLVRSIGKNVYKFQFRFYFVTHACIRFLLSYLGVSNFNSEQIDRLLANCKIKPVTNQVEVGPSISQKKLTKFCKDRDIVITGYSPLGRPYASDLFPDAPKLAFLDPRVIAVGEKYGKTGAQVVIRYLVCSKNASQ